MILNLDEITGFSCSDSEINVCALDGRPLYWRDNPRRKNITFNLPVGDWETDNQLKQLSRPLTYVTPELPFPTVIRKVKQFRFYIEPNPNKCTIDPDSDPDFADVIIDPFIWNQDIPFLIYVLYHENGHFNYGGKKPGTEDYIMNEFYCDIYAATQMLKRGYNLTQCNYAGELCLSEANDSRRRKDLLFNWLKKVKVRL